MDSSPFGENEAEEMGGSQRGNNSRQGPRIIEKHMRRNNFC